MVNYHIKLILIKPKKLQQQKINRNQLMVDRDELLVACLS